MRLLLSDLKSKTLFLSLISLSACSDKAFDSAVYTDPERLKHLKKEKSESDEIRDEIRKNTAEQRAKAESKVSGEDPRSDAEKAAEAEREEQNKKKATARAESLELLKAIQNRKDFPESYKKKQKERIAHQGDSSKKPEKAEPKSEPKKETPVDDNNQAEIETRRSKARAKANGEVQVVPDAPKTRTIEAKSGSSTSSSEVLKIRMLTSSIDGTAAREVLSQIAGTSNLSDDPTEILESLNTGLLALELTKRSGSNDMFDAVGTIEFIVPVKSENGIESETRTIKLEDLGYLVLESKDTFVGNLRVGPRNSSNKLILKLRLEKSASGRRSGYIYFIEGGRNVRILELTEES